MFTFSAATITKLPYNTMVRKIPGTMEAKVMTFGYIRRRRNRVFVRTADSVGRGGGQSTVDRGAFTLLELLTVIAIIAVLAAILFPVFARAKEAAKVTVALSNCKQLGMGQLLYQEDSDDAFSPVSVFDGHGAWEIKPFCFLQQPYMRSWGVVMDPLTPATLGSNNKVIGGQWAMPPRRVATISTSPADFTMGHTPQGKQFTAGQLYYYDGIAGVAKDPTDQNANWASWNYQVGNVPSLTQTSLSDPADIVMLVQAAAYDMMWQLYTEGDTPDNWDRYWEDPIYNLYGDQNTICGPIARDFAAGEAAGIINQGSQASAKLPTGMTIFVATDGHAKIVPWAALMGTTVSIGNGNVAIKAFWPQ